jgi:hypothetical protein
MAHKEENVQIEGEALESLRAGMYRTTSNRGRTTYRAC